MKEPPRLSRRKFMGGLAATIACLGADREAGLSAESSAPPILKSGGRKGSVTGYDSFAKLSFNENPYGPSATVLEAMTQAFKFANRYGAPDSGLVGALAAHHGVGVENILLGAGSTEILEVAASAFLAGHKKVVGVEPTFGTVYEFATGLQAGSIVLPLLPDYRQDMAALVKAARDNVRQVGFVYLCNPNNPTGLIVSKEEVRQLLDGVPENIPVLIDEAYHHFVEDPRYETSVNAVREKRPVIVSRTFSKIAALAGMRLGYAIAQASLIERLRPFTGNMHINTLVKWGAVAALNDATTRSEVKNKTVELRKKTTTELAGLGYRVLPSETNFFMVHLRRPVSPVIQAFRQKGILVGRPFPPMLEYLRVSVGTADEMARFMAAFKEILT
jgi:histidinol-phosphate aminotransferase